MPALHRRAGALAHTAAYCAKIDLARAPVSLRQLPTPAAPLPRSLWLGPALAPVQAVATSSTLGSTASTSSTRRGT
jgi:hypothetical protein